MDPRDLLQALLQGGELDVEAEPTPPTDEAIRSFWAGFARDEAALASEGVSVAGVVEIHRRLADVCGALVPEVGPPDAAGRLMLAISADGILDHAPWAEQVAAAAPPLARWSVRAFRPPKPLVDGAPCGPNPLTPDVVRFHLEPSEESPGKLDLVLCLPDEVPEPLQSTFGFQLLDAALGERTVMTSLDGIDVGSSEDLEDWEIDVGALRPLTELPAAVRAFGIEVEEARA